ncbi:MAG: phytoene/squalene synthase family protein [Flavobacteriales bacterium]
MTSMKLYDEVCLQASRATTFGYSTSFGLGVRSLHKRFRAPIHSIYGFVRFADEIVDTFHTHDKQELLRRFTADTWRAIEEGISLNPILHSFQSTVRKYAIDRDSIGAFLRSMAMDLEQQRHDRRSFEEYILGSAEVVGLMCLRVFCEGDDAEFQRLKPPAMRLGAAFQKINFLRDMRHDHQQLGRTYFPGVDVMALDANGKRAIELSIDADFDAAFQGIKELPRGARFGVYVAYRYYKALHERIRSLPSERILAERISVPNTSKASLLMRSYVRHSLGLL